MIRVIFYFILLLYFTGLQYVNAQKTYPGTGFTYSGEVFEDIDWGHIYQTSEQDRIQLSSAHNFMKQAVDSLLKDPGDYFTEVRQDMSFVFDPEKQKENLANGSKCVTCYYMLGPHSGKHLAYTLCYRFSIKEESNTARLMASFEDSLHNIMNKDLLKKRRNNKAEQTEKEIQAEHEKFEKEVEKMDFSNGNIDPVKLKEFEDKAKIIAAKADRNSNAQKLDNNYYQNAKSFSYAPDIDVRMSTNEPLLSSDIAQFADMKNNSDYYYEELKLPGCSYAIIYYDKYNLADNLTFSNNPVFIAYSGNIYAKESDCPRAWVKPFCVKLGFSGNLSQIKNFISKIDFTKLKRIIKH